MPCHLMRAIALSSPRLCLPHREWIDSFSRRAVHCKTNANEENRLETIMLLNTIKYICLFFSVMFVFMAVWLTHSSSSGWAGRGGAGRAEEALGLGGTGQSRRENGAGLGGAGQGAG